MPEEYKQKIERLAERRHRLDYERSILLHKQLTEDEMAVRDNTRTQSVPQVLPTFTQLKINSDLRNRTNNQISETLIEAEEKQKQKEAQERFANMTDEERKAWVQEQWDKTEGLGEADSATDWYYAIEEDPQKRAEWDRNAETVSSIGATIATLPFTAGLGIRGGKHALNVLFNPMKAKTAAGTAAAMTLDVYLGYKGLEHAANTIDKWRNGEFDSEDIPNFALDVMGTLPIISHSMNAYRNATNMFNTANQINKAKKVATNYYDPVHVKAMSNETVNAPGNSEAIYTNPLEATVYNKQITNQLSSKTPSKLTKAELEGIPKHERNNVDRVMEKVKSKFSTELPDPIYTGSYQSEIASDAAKVINIGNAKSLITRPDLENYNWNAINDRIKFSFLPANKSVDKIKLFVNQLNDLEVSPAFSNVNNKVNHMVALYRGYLRKLGYQSHNLTDDEISKLLQYYYNQLNNDISGVGKDLILYHGVGGGRWQPLEQYNLLDQGIFTNNMGRSGPGFYFSTVPAYSGPRSEFNIQPYLINNLNNAMSAKDLGYTGQVGNNIKSYVTDLDDLAKSMGVSKKEFTSRFQKLLPDESKTLVVDSFESAHSTLPGFYNNPNIDFRYRGPSQNIKSLFPHPDRFITNADGTASFIPVDWNDVRFNYKNGGKIYE